MRWKIKRKKGNEESLNEQNVQCKQEIVFFKYNTKWKNKMKVNLME